MPSATKTENNDRFPIVLNKLKEYKRKAKKRQDSRFLGKKIPKSIQATKSVETAKQEPQTTGTDFNKKNRLSKTIRKEKKLTLDEKRKIISDSLDKRLARLLEEPEKKNN